MTKIQLRIPAFLESLRQVNHLVLIWSIKRTEIVHHSIKYNQLKLIKNVILMHTNFLQKDVYSAGKQFLVSSSKIMTGGMYFIVVLGLGVFNFISQALVFFSLLYFLITSKSGGVMYQVLDMVPVSDQTRQRCATVLDHAVSSVLLTTTKTMFYQVLCFIPTFHSQTT